MDRLQAMSVLVAVAEEQGFAAAGRRLSMSPPAVTRAVAALEARLGIQLLLRTTRHVRLTEAGQQYVNDARRILAQVELADEAVSGLHATPRGHLVVTAPAMFGRLYMTPVITAFLRRYEQVTVSAVFVDRVTNLIEEGIDVGLRIGELPDSSLRAICLGSVKLKTYASADYLNAYGVPDHPEALHGHRLIASVAANRSSQWHFKAGNKILSPRLRPQLTCSTNDAAITAAADGFGITRVLSYQAGPEEKAGRLLPILEAFDGAAIPVNLVYSEGHNSPARLRAFLDLAAEALRALPVLLSD